MTERSSIRWLSQHQFSWTMPFLTFESRKLELLAWLEANADAVAMVSTEDSFGVGLAEGRRIRMHRGGLIVERFGRDATLPEAEILEAACRIMSSTDLLHTTATGVWTVPLPDVRYEDACRVFAMKTVQEPLLDLGVSPFDAAVLFDAQVDAARGGGVLKIEYGVVDPDELVERCADPNFGRISDAGSSRSPLRVRDVADQPPASLFAEVVRRPSSVPLEASELRAACESAEDFIAEVVFAFSDCLPSQEPTQVSD